MTWHPTANRTALKARAEMYERLRHFFAQRKVLEVETPLLGLATVTDPYLPAITADNGYLQTSPSSYMQRLMAAGSGDIYQISKAFRKVPVQAQQAIEFSVLEWFRIGFDQWDLMEETADVLEPLLTCHHFEYHSYQAIFEQYLGLNPLEAEVEQLKFEARQHLNVEMPRATKDDWLHLLMGYFIEPSLGRDTPVFIYDYPASQAGMASLSQDEKGAEVAERFQLYYRGMVLASGYRSLTDSGQLQQRLQQDNEVRVKKGLKVVPMDGDLLQAVAYGLPACACASLGLDRVLMLQLKAGHIQEVMSFIRPL